MNPADEMAAKLGTGRHLAGAAASSDDKLDQQLHAVLKDLQRVGLQPDPVEEDEPVERDDLRPGITSYLDHEASERKAIYDRLVAIENAMKKRGSRGFGRYLAGLAILWRISKANNRDESPGTWLVATGQANDRDFDSVDWLDEITEWSWEASATRCADCAYHPHARPGAGAANDTESRSAAAKRRATGRRSRPDGA